MINEIYRVCRVSKVWNDGTKIFTYDHDPVEIFYTQGDIVIRRMDSRKEMLVFSLDEWQELIEFIEAEIAEVARREELENATTHS